MQCLYNKLFLSVTIYEIQRDEVWAEKIDYIAAPSRELTDCEIHFVEQ